MGLTFPGRLVGNTGDRSTNPSQATAPGTLEHAGSIIIGATRPEGQSPTDQVTSVWCLCRMTGEECVVRAGKERTRKLPDLPRGKCPVTFPEPIFPLCLRAFVFANLCGEGPLGAIPARSRQDSVSGILSRAGSRGSNVMAHEHGTHSVDRLRPGGEEGPQGLEAASQPFCPSPP